MPGCWSGQRSANTLRAKAFAEVPSVSIELVMAGFRRQFEVVVSHTNLLWQSSNILKHYRLCPQQRGGRSVLIAYFCFQGLSAPVVSYTAPRGALRPRSFHIEHSVQVLHRQIQRDLRSGSTKGRRPVRLCLRLDPQPPVTGRGEGDGGGTSAKSWGREEENSAIGADQSFEQLIGSARRSVVGWFFVPTPAPLHDLFSRSRLSVDSRQQLFMRI